MIATITPGNQGLVMGNVKVILTNLLTIIRAMIGGHTYGSNANYDREHLATTGSVH